MAFTDTEVLRLSGNVLAAGVIDSNPNSAWYEKFIANNFIIDPETIWAEMGRLRKLPASSFSEAVANSVANPDLIKRIGINSDGTFDDTTALRMTPVAGTNFTTYVSYIDFNNPSSGVQRSWIMPQMIPRSNGFPSAAYSPVIFSGLPSGGNRILTSTGNDGNWVSHFWNAAGGLLLIAEDSAPPSTTFPNQDIYICGMVYNGLTGGGVGVEGGDEYTQEYLGEFIRAGDKFTNFGNVICVSDHIGKYPLDIFDGNWRHIGDDRTFRFKGNDSEKLTRLITSYSSITTPVKTEGTTVFTNSPSNYVNQDIENVFYDSLRAENGSYRQGSTGYTSRNIFSNGRGTLRIYCELGETKVLNGLFYVNGDGNRAIKTVAVYGANTQPTDNWGDTTNLTQLYFGNLEPNVFVNNTTETNNIRFNDSTQTYSWVVIDIYSVYSLQGNSECSFEFLQPYSGIFEVTTTPPINGVYTTYEPYWGDHGNGQGEVILNLGDGGHGLTEWAYSEAASYNTLHIRNKDVLCDKNGELILFERSPYQIAQVDVNADTSGGNVRVEVHEAIPVYHVNVGVGTLNRPRFAEFEVPDHIDSFNVKYYNSGGHNLGAGSSITIFANNTGNGLSFTIPVADVNAHTNITFQKTIFGGGNDPAWQILNLI